MTWNPCDLIRERCTCTVSNQANNLKVEQAWVVDLAITTAWEIDQTEGVLMSKDQIMFLSLKVLVPRQLRVGGNQFPHLQSETH
jgi:hypothetical protein